MPGMKKRELCATIFVLPDGHGLRACSDMMVRSSMTRRDDPAVSFIERGNSPTPGQSVANSAILAQFTGSR